MNQKKSVTRACNEIRGSDLYQKVAEETRTQIRGQLLINISHPRNILHVFLSRFTRKNLQNLATKQHLDIHSFAFIEQVNNNKKKKEKTI